MQQSVQVPKEGERFPDLVITVNKGLADECIYIIELKYLKKTEARDKKSDSALQRLLNKATEELAAYKSALDFKGKNVKAYAMVLTVFTVSSTRVYLSAGAAKICRCSYSNSDTLEIISKSRESTGRSLKW